MKFLLFFGSLYLLIFTTPLWLILLLVKRRKPTVIDEFSTFYDMLFRGLFTPIEMLIMYRKPK